MLSKRTALAVGASTLAAITGTVPAEAVDVGVLRGDQVQLDVTETSVVAQRFDARDNEFRQDSGWGEWMNRLNAALRWGRWTAGMRLNSAVYWRRPLDNPNYVDLSPAERSGVARDDQSRFRNSLYPAKAWVTYSAPGVEFTVGDAYVQFGRGLTLSMRKIDELGIDTTLRGVRAQVQKDPFALTAVAGFGNPSRIDEATGRALFPTVATRGDRTVPLFGSDRVVGVEVQAGRGLPLTLGTRAVRFTRCAPYHYDANGNIVSDFASAPATVVFGTCEPRDTATWLSSLPNAPPSLDASEVTMVGQSLEAPTLRGHGKLYLEAAMQQRHHDRGTQNLNGNGNALYAALSLDIDRLTTTVEAKSNRNFYVMPAGIELTRANDFIVDAYSFVPPAETPNQLDTQFGNFNACVDAARIRADVRVTPDWMLWAQGVYAYTKSEQITGSCEATGRTVSSLRASDVQDRVWDGVGGLEWTFDGAMSHVYFSSGARDDTKANGNFTYRELHVEYSIAKYLGAAWSIEVQGRHRLRKEESTNLDATYAAQWWHEGENYVAVKIAPRWVLSQGFEYTTLVGQPSYYVNGSLLYKFTSGSNLRLFVGQQRGAFRCASGVCRYFPPFEGARAELTLRF
ncbi:MAG: DUF6029 family protein [Myxococcota bacterium]|nr:DUF6029 family protein [Myxococcota bacterium]